MSETCETCRFFRSTRRECWRFPPVPVQTYVDRTPQVPIDFGCGEHQPIKPQADVTDVNAEMLAALKRAAACWPEATDIELEVMIGPWPHAVLAARRAVRKIEGATDA